MCDFGLSSPIYGALADRHRSLSFKHFDNDASSGNFDAKNCSVVGQYHYICIRGRLVPLSLVPSPVIFEKTCHFGPVSPVIFDSLQTTGDWPTLYYGIGPGANLVSMVY
jgi:hypothetical protein